MSGRALLRVALLLGVVSAVPTLVDEVRTLADRAARAVEAGQTGSAVACPSAAAAWLPASTGGYVLVGQYETERHVITLCQDGAGAVYYDGQIKGAAVTQATHISLPATLEGQWYVAVNGDYSYAVDGARVVVRKSGVTQMDAPLSLVSAP